MAETGILVGILGAEEATGELGEGPGTESHTLTPESPSHHRISDTQDPAFSSCFTPIPPPESSLPRPRDASELDRDPGPPKPPTRPLLRQPWPAAPDPSSPLPCRTSTLQPGSGFSAHHSSLISTKPLF